MAPNFTLWLSSNKKPVPTGWGNHACLASPPSFQSKLGKGRQVRHTVSDILLWISLFRVCIITRDKTLGELQISKRKWCWETGHSERQELQIVQHRVKTPLLLRLMSRQSLYITPPPTIRTLAHKPYSLAAVFIVPIWVLCLHWSMAVTSYTRFASRWLIFEFLFYCSSCPRLHVFSLQKLIMISNHSVHLLVCPGNITDAILL